jgi:hypothetical protein
MMSDSVADCPVTTPEGRAHGGSTPSTGKLQAERARYLIVVSREQPDLWRHLRQILTGVDGVDVVLDRRYGGRWQWSQSREFQERGADRRQHPLSETLFGHRSFVIVNPAESTTSVVPA